MAYVKVYRPRPSAAPSSQRPGCAVPDRRFRDRDDHREKTVFLFEEAAHGTLAKWGVKTSGVEVDLDAMHGSRKEAVKGLTQGIEFLFKKNKVEWLKGLAALDALPRLVVQAVMLLLAVRIQIVISR